MNTKFTLKNFRCFDSKGVTVDLKPITLLTGCNNSGKSSIVKALMLLSDYFQELKDNKKNGREGLLTKHYLDFTKKPNNLLGNFSKIVNNKSEDKTITMELGIKNEYDIELKFKENENDILTNGIIESLRIKKADGSSMLFSDNVNKGSKENNIYSFFLDKFFEDPTTSSWINRFQATHSPEKIKFLNKFEDKIKSNKILFFLPIIEGKLSGSKEDSINFLNSSLENEIISKMPVREAIKKIIENFKNSEESSFVDWYRKEERTYLSSLGSPNSINDIFLLPKRKSISVFGWCYCVDRKFKKDIEFVKTISEFENSHSNFSNTHKFFFRDLNEYRDISYSSSEDYFCDIFAVMEFLSFMYEKDDPYYSELVEYKNMNESSRTVGNVFLQMYRIFKVFKKEEVNDEVYKNIQAQIDSIGQEGFPTNVTIESKLDYMFLDFVVEELKRIICDAPPKAIQYVSSTVASIKRLYSMEVEDEFTGLLKRYSEAKAQTSDNRHESFINKWIKEFGIGDHISINADSEGLGVTIRLHKDENDKEGSLLADSGYGITQLFAIILNIEVAIMEKKYTTEERTIAIEEPEIHLHPSYQSKLADMFYEAYKEYGIHFIVETHSEYLIRRTQVLVAQMNYASNEKLEETCPFTTYYVPKNAEPYALGYRKDGLFKEDFGPGFYDEASNLAFEIL